MPNRKFGLVKFLFVPVVFGDFGGSGCFSKYEIFYHRIGIRLSDLMCVLLVCAF